MSYVIYLYNQFEGMFLLILGAILLPIFFKLIELIIFEIRNLFYNNKLKKFFKELKNKNKLNCENLFEKNLVEILYSDDYYKGGPISHSINSLEFLKNIERDLKIKISYKNKEEFEANIGNMLEKINKNNLVSAAQGIENFEKSQESKYFIRKIK